ncbi:MAG: transposase [Candidatus Gorgyraea atricola]|nr:transposase [Candidatus Gorgyraea atricola]
MGRLKRYFEEGYPYLITTATFNRKPIFRDERNCKILLATIEFFKLVLDYKLFAYCLMPDHLHLIIQTYGIYNISYIMKMIKGNFARKYNKMLSTQGKVWQDRFYDTGLRNHDVLLQKIEYIHNNPVRAKLTTTPDEYPFSSYNYYFGNNYSGIPEIDKIEP